MSARLSGQGIGADEGPRLAVIGAGVSGLAAADRLLEAAGPGRSVIVLEAGERLGGVIRTEEIAGRPVDLGADSLVTRSPGLMELVDELGLGERLIEPAHGTTMVWARGRLRPLPLGVMAGVPDGAWPLIRSGLMSPLGVARAGLDLVLPRTGPEDVDDNLGELIRRRFGRELLENVLDPLIGGIHHARCEELSLSVVAPQFAKAASEGRSVLRELRRGARSSPEAQGPMLVAPAGGIQELTDALARRISARGGVISATTPVAKVGDGVITTESGERLAVDGVVLALRPGAASGVLAEAAPAASSGLADLGSRPATLLVMVFEPEAERALPPGNGLLVPEAAGGTVRAATWVTRKWPERGGDGRTIVRCSLDSERVGELGDGEIVDAARTDLERRIGPLPALREARVERIGEALLAPRPGHLARVAEIESSLASEMPSARLAGPQMRGAGIGACIAAAHSAADSLLDLVSSPTFSVPEGAEAADGELNEA